VAAEAAAQREWMRSGTVQVPSDEVIQDLGNVVFSHQPRLMRAGLLTSEATAAVAEILAEFEPWTDMTLWQSDEAMERPEWGSVRQTARRALDVIDGLEPRVRP
jgi:hypothetical protein